MSESSYNSYRQELQRRGRTQNLFLVKTYEFNDLIKPLLRKYDIIGSTGNIYTVKISNNCTCTCPHHMTRHIRCKHIYFILNRVMKVTDQDEECDYYNDEKLLEMFMNVPDVTNILRGNKAFVEAYNIVRNANPDKFSEDEPGTIANKTLEELKPSTPEFLLRKVNARDNCPTCLTEFEDQPVVRCIHSCGNFIHATCFEAYKNYCNKNKQELECMYCRAPWDGKLKPSSTVLPEYVNLIGNLHITDETDETD